MGSSQGFFLCCTKLGDDERLPGDPRQGGSAVSGPGEIPAGHLVGHRRVQHRFDRLFWRSP